MKLKRRIMIGTDPEYFIRKKNSSHLVSAIPFIKGDKQNPTPLPSGGNVQVDNVAVEFATKPASSTEAFITNLKASITETIAVLPKGHELAVLPSANFDPKELEDPKAYEFGCSADFCAWELIENPTPIVDDPTFRSCGGHIHVGCLNEDGDLIDPDAEFLLDFHGKIAMVRGMDLFHGIISTILDCSPEAVARRKLYGKAGCHRNPEYGIEYRALSNYWTKSPMSSMLMSSLTDVVVELIVNKELDELIETVGGNTIQDVINTGNSKKATSILENYLYPHLDEDSKFFLEECLTKLDKEPELVKAWEISI